MLSFIKLDEENGIWANTDETLKYLNLGYKAYKDCDLKEEISIETLKETTDKDTTGLDSDKIETVTIGG